jgi:hypothetical protein
MHGTWIWHGDLGISLSSQMISTFSYALAFINHTSASSALVIMHCGLFQFKLISENMTRFKQFVGLLVAGVRPTITPITYP